MRASHVGFIAASLLAVASLPLRAQAPVADRYRQTADRIIDESLRDSAAWNRLAELTDKFGNRLSGSASLERAIDWVLAEMKKDGLDNVHGERVKVPRWIRGQESVTLIRPRNTSLKMLGLGGSIATPKAGITARVLVVSSFDDLKARAADAKGKIVLFDVPFTSYGQTVQYRVNGAVEAAKVGAVASMIRSVGPFSMQNPHTGVMRYDTTGKVKKIPHAAISNEAAAMLHRMQNRGDTVVVRLVMSGHMLPDSWSRNVVAEITGSERPQEVVVFGGHMDSWDVGSGAMDDAGGVMVAWEALRVMKRLGLKPRRTIRVVGWTNEENGSKGGLGYRDAHASEIDSHVLAIESDGGVFAPQGFGFTGSDSAFALVRQVGSLLKRIGADSITRGGGGADVEPLMERGVPGMGLQVQGAKYFWYHHSDADNVDKLDPREVAECVATMAVMAYVVGDMSEGLPRAVKAP
jgi:carboxypeptidase Q